MNENELSQQLHSVAATVNPQPDLAEVEMGAGRVRGRRRIATGVVAAMLVAGAGGVGFGIGRSVADEGEQISAAASVDTADGTPQEASTTTTAVISTDTDLSVLPRPTAPPTRTAGSATEPGDEAAADDAAAVDEGYGLYQPEPLNLVYERRLDSGIRVRLMSGQSWSGDQWYGPGWRPAAFCWATAESRLTIDGPDVVDVLGYGWYEELFKGLSVQPIDAGWADGHPLRILQVQTAPDATEVAVVWVDGASDRTAVVDGVAVLVVDGENPYTDYTFEITDATGTRSMTNEDLDYQHRDPDFRAACEEPPPALPEAGEQPVDPAAAEAALLERFEILWDRSIAEGNKPDDLLDDRTGVDEAITMVFDGMYSDSADSAAHTVEELVFTSPTEAWFRYGIDTINGYFSPRYGTATLVDGVWVFPRALVCQDLGLAGGGCDPWAEQIYPPSWFERYGDPYSECWITENGEEVCETSATDEGYLVPITAPPVGTAPPVEG